MQLLRSNTAISNATIITTAKVETSASAHAKHGSPLKTNSYASTGWLTESSQRSSSAPSQPFNNAATNSKSKMTNSRCPLSPLQKQGTIFATKNTLRVFSVYPVVIPKGVEPLIFWMRTRRPGPLDDGTNYFYILTENQNPVNRPSKLQHIFDFFKH